MEDQSTQYAHLNLQKGERVYLLDTGHVYKLYMLRDDVRSSHGREALWMQGTEIDPVTKQYHIRKDGKIAIHEHGKHVYSLGDGEFTDKVGNQITMRAWVQLERKEYLEKCARMSDNHVAVNELDDLLVSSSEAHHIPESLPHLLPDEYDEEYGTPKPKMVR